MDAEEIKKRTKQYAIDIGKLTLQLERNDINRNYCNQIIGAGSSVGANYRASRRAKSKADFINKLKIVEEELDESLFFPELLFEFNPKEKDVIIALFKEGEELLKSSSPHLSHPVIINQLLQCTSYIESHCTSHI